MGLIFNRRKKNTSNINNNHSLIGVTELNERVKIFKWATPESVRKLQEPLIEEQSAYNDDAVQSTTDISETGFSSNTIQDNDSSQIVYNTESMDYVQGYLSSYIEQLEQYTINNYDTISQEYYIEDNTKHEQDARVYPKAFIDICEEYLIQVGCTNIQRYPFDPHIDIVCKFNDKIFAVLCTGNRKNRVGIDSVNKLNAGVDRLLIDGGIIMANTSPTEKALLTMNQLGIQFILI